MKLNNFIEEIKSEKYLLVFFGIFFIFVYFIYKNISFCKKNIENMTILDDKQIIQMINKYYSSNDFVNTITNVSKKIENNGLQIQGNIDIIGNVKADGEVSNQNISLTNFKIKIDDKVKLLADRKAAADKAKADADKAAADKIPSKGTCGHSKRRVDSYDCPGLARVLCANNTVYNNDCFARANGCINCLRT